MDTFDNNENSGESSSLFVFQEALTPETVQQSLAIQVQVFAEEQGIPSSLVHDNATAAALHVLALHQGIPVATGRLTVNDDNNDNDDDDEKKKGTLARIAVLPSHRGRGLGKLIVKRLEELARRKGLVRVSLCPHRYLESFYASLGYDTLPDSLHKVGPCTLIIMTKRLV